MTRVFVHGIPETSKIWDSLRDELGEESVALSLPGFGTPRPEGFGATKDEYAEWLLRELGKLDDPIDLVGHDWGGILTSRVAATHGDRLRSWVTDAVSPLDPSFEWHDLAKIWQTPGDGEAFWDGLRETPDDNAALLGSLGVPDADARDMAAALDETMVASILDLVRSAVDIGREWEATSPGGAPGLVVVGTADPYGDEENARRIATRLGADVVLLPDLGHWWPAQGPAAAARAIKEFWAGLGD